MKSFMDQLNALYVKCFLTRTLKNEKGQGLVEYALIVVLIALVAIVAMKALGKGTNNVFSNAASTMANPGN